MTNCQVGFALDRLTQGQVQSMDSGAIADQPMGYLLCAASAFGMNMANGFPGLTAVYQFMNGLLTKQIKTGNQGDQEYSSVAQWNTRLTMSESVVIYWKYKPDGNEQLSWLSREYSTGPNRMEFCISQ